MKVTAEPEATSTASSASGFAKAAKSPNRTKPVNIPAKLIFLGTFIPNTVKRISNLLICAIVVLPSTAKGL